jgi:hypothetical protein
MLLDKAHPLPQDGVLNGPLHRLPLVEEVEIFDEEVYRPPEVEGVTQSTSLGDEVGSLSRILEPYDPKR